MSPDPSLIGKYRVERRLGQGGMGTVYLAHDTRIGRHVAVKLLRVDDEDTRQRFEVEAQAAGRLKHPNIVTVYDYGDYEGNPCLVMEYIEGDTIAALIDHGPWPLLSERLDLIEQVCRGLGFAHRAGIVHRDIKPSNLMVDGEGVMKILDFGIARTTERGLTSVGHVVGTAAYMSPEQVRGERVDARSDIFAVGLVLYEFVTGRRAFPGDSDFAVYNAILTGTPEPFTHTDPRVTAAMAPIFDTVLAKDPARRYQDVDTLGVDLARVRRLLPVDAGGSTTKAVTPVPRMTPTPSPIVTPPVVPSSPKATPSPGLTPAREARPSVTPPSSPVAGAPEPKIKSRPPWEPNPRPVDAPQLTPPSGERSEAAGPGDQFELPLRVHPPEHAAADVIRSEPPVDAEPGDAGRRSMALLIPAAVVAIVLIAAGIKYLSPDVSDSPRGVPGIGNASGGPAPPSIPPGSIAVDAAPPTPANPAAAAAVPPPSPIEPTKVPSADKPRPRADPHVVEKRLGVASRLVEDGQFDRAIAEYEAILREDPRNAIASAQLVKVRQAKAAEQKTLLPRHVAERVKEGQQFYSEGQYDAAIAAYQAALLLDPTSQAAIDGIAQARKAKKPPG